ncbi:hypothetical protein [Paraburkholderia domus]|uniref:hypothetical protein n=1 Tax=Paraburkholderia domus TaxID=2793075 RepID=UPI001B2F73D3|nr:hypothetical protein [Paraburkholderia domus]CAE6697446.1 hypothetical protein R75483_00669 [Paraburkholderia domus]
MDQTYDIDQARLAAKVGAITTAHVRAVDGNQWAVVFTTPAGTPELVTTRQRDPRRFRDAALALKALRDIGILSAVVDMERWDTAAGKPPAWSRPEQSKAMKARHQRAAADAELEQRVKETMGQSGSEDWTKNDQVVAAITEKIKDIEFQSVIEDAVKAGPPSSRIGRKK